MKFELYDPSWFNYADPMQYAYTQHGYWKLTSLKQY